MSQADAGEEASGDYSEAVLGDRGNFRAHTLTLG